MKISRFTVWAYLLALIVICPTYISVAGINVSNILLALFYLCTLYTNQLSFTNITSAIKKLPLFWLFLMIWFLQTCFDSGIYHGIMYLYNTVFFLVAVVLRLTNTYKIDVLARTLVKTSAPLCLLGIAEEFTGVNIFSLLWGGDEIYREARISLNRIYSTFTHPISYGIYLVFIMILALYLIKKYKRKRFWLNILLLFINLCFTVSRSIIVIGIVCVIVLMFIYGELRFTRKSLPYHLFGAVVVVGMLAVFPNINEFFTEIGLSLIATFDSSVTGSSLGSAAGNRFDLLEWTILSVRGNEIFGMGTNTKFSYTLSSEVWGKVVKESLENQYLLTYFHHGIVGVATYILSVLNLLWFAIRKHQKTMVTEFDSAFLISCIMYMLMLFATAESAERMLWLVIIGMAVASKCEKIYKQK